MPEFGTGSADSWRDHLAQNNRFDDPDWVILEIINVKRIKVEGSTETSGVNPGSSLGASQNTVPQLIREVWPGR